MTILSKIKHWYFCRKVNKAIRLLDSIDYALRDAGMPKWQVKQFWRDFIKRRKVREQTFLDITQ